MRLPKSFYRYFWDIDFKKLDSCKKPQYIIQRLLEMGDEKAVRWLRKNFDEKEIAETIKKRRGFSPKTVNFWAYILKIPPKEIVCLQKPYLKQHKIHWPY